MTSERAAQHVQAIIASLDGTDCEVSYEHHTGNASDRLVGHHYIIRVPYLLGPADYYSLDYWTGPLAEVAEFTAPRRYRHGGSGMRSRRVTFQYIERSVAKSVRTQKKVAA